MLLEVEQIWFLTFSTKKEKKPNIAHQTYQMRWVCSITNFVELLVQLFEFLLSGRRTVWKFSLGLPFISVCCSLGITCNASLPSSNLSKHPSPRWSTEWIKTAVVNSFFIAIAVFVHWRFRAWVPNVAFMMICVCPVLSNLGKQICHKFEGHAIILV